MARSLVVSIPEDRRVYSVGDSFDISSLSIFYTDELGMTTTIPPSSCIISGFDSSSPTTSQIITVRYKEYFSTFIIRVVSNELTSIYIASLPKLEYYKDENLQLDGLSIHGTYSNGKDCEIPLSQVTISNYDFHTVCSSYPITISYGGFFVSFPVCIRLPAITGIFSKSIVYKVLWNGYIDKKELYLYYSYEDGTSTLIENPDITSIHITKFDASYVGLFQAIISYAGFQTVIDYEVVYPIASSISIGKQPEKLDYFLYEKLDLAGMVCEVIFEDRQRTRLYPSQLQVSSFDSSNVGMSKVAYIFFQDIGTTFLYNVYPTVITSIFLIPPSKTCYLVGENLDISGLLVFGLLEDGTRYIIDSNYCTISGFQSECESLDQICTVQIASFKATFPVFIVSSTMEELLIERQPSSLQFIEDTSVPQEAFHDIGVSMIFHSGKRASVPFSLLSFSKVDTTIVGMQSVIVTYEGLSDSFSIEILQKEFSDISIERTPYKQIYTSISQEKLRVDGLSVIGIYNDGEQISILIDSLHLFGYDFSVDDGYQYITVGYVQEGKIYENTFPIYYYRDEGDMEISAVDIFPTPEYASIDEQSLHIHLEIGDIEQDILYSEFSLAFPEYSISRRPSEIVIRSPDSLEHIVSLPDYGFHLIQLNWTPLE